MAESPSHKFGQIIGATLEAAIHPLLESVARKYGLYLDRKGPRPARNGKKVTWRDKHGNTHDLDYVLERGGARDRIGVPVAFIESAWRRYTKHSRNKAQEIQGAIVPLRETHSRSAPFIGVVLAGEFTASSLEQLRSLGFCVLHFPYQAVIKAFATVGIDALSTEDMPDADFALKVGRWGALTDKERRRVAAALIRLNKLEIDRFIEALILSITRQIASVRILPLHGLAADFVSVSAAISFVEQYHERPASCPLVKYEITLTYNNGDKIAAQFADKLDAVSFLEQYQGPELTPVV